MKFQTLTRSWEFRQQGESDWSPATVPGGVHSDLLALGRIPDPFAGDNEKKVTWVAEKDWEYRCRFIVSTELMALPHLWLVCDGLDTLAEVFLNGELLGNTANMFRQYRFDVKQVLIPGENELLIQFKSPVVFVTRKQAVRPMVGVSQAIAGSPYLRKAPCQFGWDWGPQLPPIGIWKEIRLEGTESARLSDVYLKQEHSADLVTVTARVTLEKWSAGAFTVSFSMETPDGQIYTVKEPAREDGQPTELSIVIDHPQLWWPNGYGEQPLYPATVELTINDYRLDSRQYQLGLRTIELRQEPDEWGTSFRFVVNGQPIFAKGSNWIPADSFPTRITNASLERLIRSAAATHQNMLRVWGGGFYEDERFYDLCDRYGILVWQEFIFSCSSYPLDDEEFLENIHHEVNDNVRRLRHRASLALWCGNNEMEQGWAEWAWDRPEFQSVKFYYDRFFHHTLPAWCKENDPDREYWPSSPSSNTPFENPNGQQQGDAHYWDVWHGRKPFTAYRNQYPRFMSEFGFQALPPLTTIKTYAQEADWNMTSYIMECHQKNDSGNQLMVAQMLDTFRLPDDFESLVYLSLVLQAEGIRYGVEHWRRHPRRVAGTLYWQLNDCWPVASWSSLDYFGRWKALHYAARRFYAPVLLSIEDGSTIQKVYLTNETRQPWEGTLAWSLEMLDGKPVKAGEVSVNVAASEAALLVEMDFTGEMKSDLSRDLAFVAELRQGTELVSRQSAFFVPTKHLNLRDPEIQTNIKLEAGSLYIQLFAHSFARLVECALEDADVVFSDNYFDLPANRTATITCPVPDGWKLEDAVKALRIRSVYNSYAHGASGT